MRPRNRDLCRVIRTGSSSEKHPPAGHRAAHATDRRPRYITSTSPVAAADRPSRGVDRREPLRNRRQRNTVGRPKPAKLSRHERPSPRLPVEIDDRDRANLACASAEGSNASARNAHGDRAPRPERERSQRTRDPVEVHSIAGRLLSAFVAVHAAPVAVVVAVGARSQHGSATRSHSRSSSKSGTAEDLRTCDSSGVRRQHSRQGFRGQSSTGSRSGLARRASGRSPE